MTNMKLKVGLLVNGPLANKGVYDLAAWANQQTDVEITHLIVHGPDPAPKPVSRFRKLLRQEGLYRTVSRLFFHLIVALEQLVTRTRSHWRQDRDLRAVVPLQLTVTPSVSHSGYVLRFRSEDIQDIQHLAFDLLIRCGAGILRGDILHAAKLGVLSFHHGDNRINRGGPPGFWEVYYRQSQTGFVIQQLTSELDGGNVVKRGSFPTQRVYSVNRAVLEQKADVHMRALLKDIAATRALPQPEERVPYSHRLFRSPLLHNCIVYCTQTALALAAGLVSRAIGLRTRWGVSFVFSHWRDAVLWRATHVDNPKGCFLADPFVIRRNGRDYCFVEEYVYDKAKAHIAVLELTALSARHLGIAVEEPFHLSFPFLFEYAGHLFMCPESSQSRDIRLYRCITFPHEWQFDRVLMEDVLACDTMLFARHGKWWLLTNIDQANMGAGFAELYVFYADSPLTGEWKAHPRNPIYIDSEVARNAGLLHDGERLFRVAQSHGFGTYGRSCSIWEIERIDEEFYVEKMITKVTPHFMRGLTRTHHMHSNGAITVVDHAQRELS
jgi:hypothetical protein